MWTFIVFTFIFITFPLERVRTALTAAHPQSSVQPSANLCWWKYLLKSANVSQIKDKTSLDSCLCWSSFFFFLNSPCVYIYLFIVFLVRKHLKIINPPNSDGFLISFVHLYSFTCLFWSHDLGNKIFMTWRRQKFTCNTSSYYISIGVNATLNFHLTSMVPVTLVSKHLHQGMLNLWFPSELVL